MGDTSALRGWPENSAVLIRRVSEQADDVLHAEGDLSVRRPWASVSKLVTSWGVARAASRSEVDLDEPDGDGVTMAHLLAHASGWRLEESSPRSPVGTRRVYSNVGVDRAVARLTSDPTQWCAHEVFVPLGLTSCALDGRPAAGVVGSLEDMGELMTAWCRGDDLRSDIHRRFRSPFLPSLAGVVPGFGRFDPCPWGLGPEVRGAKNHWMGSRTSPESYGHFGQSGTLALVDPERDVVIVAAAGEEFGPWAVERWPSWTDEIVERFAS